MNISPRLQAAFARLRAGDEDGALDIARVIDAETPGDPAVAAFLGMVLCRRQDPAAGAPYLRQALKAWPNDAATRANLATALAALGELDEAEEVCRAGPSGDSRLERILAFAHQNRGRPREAASAYEAVVAKVPQDFESWNNLGNVRVELDDVTGAIAAFERAVQLRPDIAALHINLSKQLARVERKQDRQQAMRSAVRIVPGNAELWAELGMAETAAHAFEAGERAHREALRIEPGMTLAYVELGLLLENLNRIDDLKALVESLQRSGVAEPEFLFIQAWSLRRQGRLAEAMALATQVPPTIEGLRRHQLVAELADKLGDSERAFASFVEMNEAATAQSLTRLGERDYREEVTAETAQLTPEWVGSWSRIAVDRTPPSPIFIVGFPRSGTTLLDTMLMNIGSLHVLEEQPIMRQPERMLDGFDRLSSLDAERANALRRYYFTALADIDPPRDGSQRVVDKYPLHMARMPLIHRVFPDAKVILVERHPCDVVLSCFMSNFTLNRAMRQFVTLEGAARLYDIVFESWSRATALLPISYHAVRYERMVEDAEGEMRRLLDYLGIDWDPAILDNQGAAARRHHIGTASYSQVTEPIYRRAAGRWERYREQMAPVLPILAPWAERMGYAM
jgi:tetratricopeptide (TPR) repeat protein